jgi:hypothetical protein
LIRPEVLGAAFLVLSTMTTPPSAAESLPVPEELHASLDTAVELGEQIYRADVASARATDEMAARKFLKRDKRLRGWLTAPGGSGVFVVTFVGEEAGSMVALYRVTVPPQGKATIEKLEEPAPLNAGEAAHWRARSAALAALAKRTDTCSDRYNTVVLTRAGPEGARILVYLLAATTKPRTVVAGGHFRYEYSADGAIELAHRPFTRSCLTFTAEKGKGEPVSIMLMHLLDLTPTEIHVFLGLLHGQRVAVGTQKYLWAVEGTHITLTNQRD